MVSRSFRTARRASGGNEARYARTRALAFCPVLFGDEDEANADLLGGCLLFRSASDAARTREELTAAVGARSCHALGTGGAKRALIAADESRVRSPQVGVALL